MGGGNAGRENMAYSHSGLSPRGRGKQPVFPVNGVHPRSIPAWAGETFPGRGGNVVHEVYPRVGGGNAAQLA